MSFGSPCGGGVDVGDGGLGVGDHGLDAVGEPGGGQLVGDLAHRGERGGDVLDRAAGAQVGDQRAELGQRGLHRRRAGWRRPRSSRRRRCRPRGAGGRGDELVEGQRVGLGRRAPRSGRGAAARRRRRCRRWRPRRGWSRARSFELRDELGLGGLVGDSARRGEGGVDVVDGAAGAQVARPRRAGRRATPRPRRAGSARPRCGRRRRCRRPRSLAEATSSSSGRALALADSASTWSISAGTPSAAVPMLASEVLAVARTSLRLATSCCLGRLVDQRARRGEDARRAGPAPPGCPPGRPACGRRRAGGRGSPARGGRPRR